MKSFIAMADMDKFPTSSSVDSELNLLDHPLPTPIGFGVKNRVLQEQINSSPYITFSTDWLFKTPQVYNLPRHGGVKDPSLKNSSSSPLPKLDSDYNVLESKRVSNPTFDTIWSSGPKSSHDLTNPVWNPGAAIAFYRRKVVELDATVLILQLAGSSPSAIRGVHEPLMESRIRLDDLMIACKSTWDDCDSKRSTNLVTDKTTFSLPKIIRSSSNTSLNQEKEVKLWKDYRIPLCPFCRNNREPAEIYMNHVLRNRETGEVVCPFLRTHICALCGATGGNAHTESHCPYHIFRPFAKKKSRFHF